MSTTPKFEDTKLLQHPEVKSAYQFYLDQRAAGNPNAEIVEEIGLKGAETLSQLLVNQDPHLVAAALAMPLYLNISTEKELNDVAKALQPLTLEYMETYSMMIHPMGISEVFPGLPETHKHAAIKIAAGIILEEIRELEAEAPNMAPKELYRALTQEEPTMPKFEDFVAYGMLRKTEPKLMAEYDTIRKGLMDIATGKAAPKAASSPAP